MKDKRLARLAAAMQLIRTAYPETVLASKPAPPLAEDPNCPIDCPWYGTFRPCQDCPVVTEQDDDAGDPQGHDDQDLPFDDEEATP